MPFVKWKACYQQWVEVQDFMSTLSKDNLPGLPGDKEAADSLVLSWAELPVDEGLSAQNSFRNSLTKYMALSIDVSGAAREAGELVDALDLAKPEWYVSHFKDAYNEALVAAQGLKSALLEVDQKVKDALAKWDQESDGGKKRVDPFPEVMIDLPSNVSKAFEAITSTLGPTLNWLSSPKPQKIELSF